MTNKAKTLFGGSITALFSFIAWLAAVPPEQQDAMLAPIVNLLPLPWRPFIGLFSRALASAAAIYALFQAHKSPTPPQ